MQRRPVRDGGQREKERLRHAHRLCALSVCMQAPRVASRIYLRHDRDARLSSQLTMGMLPVRKLPAVVIRKLVARPITARTSQAVATCRAGPAAARRWHSCLAGSRGWSRKQRLSEMVVGDKRQSVKALGAAPSSQAGRRQTLPSDDTRHLPGLSCDKGEAKACQV